MEAKSKKQLAAGPCSAAQVIAGSDGGKTYRYEICAVNLSAAKRKGYDKAKGEFKTNLEAAATLLIDCSSHVCQGAGQSCDTKPAVFRNVAKVAGSEVAALSALQDCNNKSHKKYDYSVRVKGQCTIGCRCGQA